MNINLVTRRSGTNLKPIVTGMYRGDLHRLGSVTAITLEQNGTASFGEKDFPKKLISDQSQSQFMSVNKCAAYERASHLLQFLVTWLLVVDKGHAQLYNDHKSQCSPTQNRKSTDSSRQTSSSYEWSLVSDGEINELPIADFLKEYKSGGVTNDNYSLENSYNLPKNHESQQGRQFTQAIADRLHQACEKNSFDRLMLVAPPHMLMELWAQCDTEVQKRIVGVHPNDPVGTQN